MKSLIYLNGELVPEEEAKVSIWDIGFMYSAVFMEAARTFRHEVYRLNDHLERMDQGMRYTGLKPLVSRREMGRIVRQTLTANLDRFAEEDDCWLCWQVTPGAGFPHPMVKSRRRGRPTVICYVSPLPYDEYYPSYRKGTPAEVPAVRNVPPSVVDPRGKTRYRLHYFKAKLEARARDPKAFALLLDTDGFVTEGTGANFFIVQDGGLVTPTTRNILDGISRRTVIEIAADLGIPVAERDVSLLDVYSAEEAFWTTSSYCMLPCNRVNHVQMKTCPGALFQSIIAAWSERVGVDVIGQARRYHKRKSNIWRSP
ncbi:MAG: aminotransferase class IV [Candidatus Latescibacteria bacterium]|jgi:branched-chain amino acid aminotransferase|nr:aminotransferase class IV [Candidatus Latescibacterota bacterium]